MDPNIIVCPIRRWAKSQGEAGQPVGLGSGDEASETEGESALKGERGRGLTSLIDWL